MHTIEHEHVIEVTDLRCVYGGDFEAAELPACQVLIVTSHGRPGHEEGT